MEIENIQEFHQRLKLMLVEIHKICVGNGIKYTMIGGSLLGALRHQRAIIAIILMYFATECPQNTPSNLPEEPSETAPADIIKVRRLALTSLKRTQSQSF